MFRLRKTRVRKRHFLLLEVIIAILLLVMCVIPLISPHTFILVQQKKFIQKIELDHLVNLAFADVVRQMYENRISWNQIINGDEFEVDELLLQRVGFDRALPYRGTYRFSEVIHKPQEEEAPRKLYLLNLDFRFVPEDEREKPFDYHYELFVVRDLGAAEAAPQEQGDQQGGGT